LVNGVDEPPEQLPKEILFGFEVIEGDALGNTSAVGNVLEGDLREAFLDDLSKSCLEKDQPPLRLRSCRYPSHMRCRRWPSGQIQIRVSFRYFLFRWSSEETEPRLAHAGSGP